MAVNGVSFTVRAGEVLGIAGVQGNGQTELVEAITGLRHPNLGTVSILGHDTTHATPRQVTEVGSAHIPEDRQKHGLVLSFSVRDNLVLCTYYRSPFAHGIGINSKLSGGNQQKVIVARELSRQVKMVIANQPTRGLDVGSIEFIHNRIIQARNKGAAVLLVSAELDEITSLSDRIAVMYKGRILDILDAKKATREQLGLLMAGITKMNEN
jgi:simple sugar transport system ATP-binding protein